MSERIPVFLRHGQSGALVPAILIDGITEAEIADAEAQWRQSLHEALGLPRAGGANVQQWPEHAHWDWVRKARRVAGLLAYQFIGVECEGLMQGLMLLNTAGRVCRLSAQAGKPLVYVDYLAAAPWNLRSLMPTPRYGAVGRVLIAAAIQISRDNEFQGRVGLHSLPQAETFYSAVCGMTDLGIDVKVERLRYFEMTPEQAARFLEGGN